MKIATFFPRIGPNKVLYAANLGLFLLLVAAYLGFAGFPLLLAIRINKVGNS